MTCNWICNCDLTGGCSKCRSFSLSFPFTDDSVTVEVSREELNKWDYDWLHSDKAPNPIKVRGRLSD